LIRTVIRLLAFAALLIGLLHVALTWPVYREASLDALWFAGSGLAIVGAALLNLVGLSAAPGPSRWAVAAMNLLLAAFFAAASLLLPGPQGPVGLAIFAALTAGFAWISNAPPRMGNPGPSLPRPPAG
jgi:hypothetical protein